jgi:hypothetical protein
MRRVVDLSLGDIIGRAMLSGEIVDGDKIKLIPGQGIGEFDVEKL